MKVKDACVIHACRIVGVRGLMVWVAAVHLCNITHLPPLLHTSAGHAAPSRGRLPGYPGAATGGGGWPWPPRIDKCGAAYAALHAKLRQRYKRGRMWDACGVDMLCRECSSSHRRTLSAGGC